MPTWPIGEEIRYDGTVHPLVAACPHYHLVPKDPAEHLEYRVGIRRMAENRPDIQRKLIQWSIDDPLFFANTFCWIVEPRGDGVIPLNTWAHQDPWLAALAHYSGIRDIKGDKSRAQGESWLLCVDYSRELFLFRNSFQAMVSLDENTADNPDNPDSLGWKVDFLHEHLPDWMKIPGLELGGPNRKLSNHTWHNPSRSLHGIRLGGSYLQAFAATGTAGKGGRRKRFGFDEAAFMDRARDLIENLRAVTNCRNVFSTPNGKGDYFAELIHRRDSWLTITLDWKDNPEQNRGLYTSDNGTLRVIKDNFQYAPDYKYVLDGRQRSYWYDRECERAGNNMIEIARELDRDYGGSVGRPFPAEALDIARRYCRTEDLRGELTFERADLSAIDHMRFAAQTEGCLKLWITLDSEGLPPAGDYCVNCDVAAGTGSDTSSNSAISIWNSAGEQVGEYASNRISPTRLAQYAIALCYWFGRGRPKSFLNWEKTGPLGTQFSNEVVRRQAYPNVYIAPDKKIRRTSKVKGDKNKRPGHHTAKTSETLEPLVSAFINQSITPRSFDLVRECSEYEFGKGDWVHPGAKNLTDESVSGFNHGDRAVAAGVAVISLIDRKWLKTAQQLKTKPTWDGAPKYSFAGRAQHWERLRQATQRATSCRW